MRLLAFRKRLISTTNRKEIPMIPIFEQAHSLFLTPTESEILDWFENHFPQCLYMNLEEMSDQLYTSSATIVRFCQKLGFKGFNEFKYQLRQQLKEQKNLHSSPITSLNTLLRSFVTISNSSISMRFRKSPIF